jgi:hypothetical protein
MHVAVKAREPMLEHARQKTRNDEDDALSRRPGAIAWVHFKTDSARYARRSTARSPKDHATPCTASRRRRATAARSTGPPTLTFFRGGCRPYGVAHRRAPRAVLPAIRDAGVDLIAIAPVIAEPAPAVIARRGLEFDIRRDAGEEIAPAFGPRRCTRTTPTGRSRTTRGGSSTAPAEPGRHQGAAVPPPVRT